jgi:hypothetical protein
VLDVEQTYVCGRGILMMRLEECEWIGGRRCFESAKMEEQREEHVNLGREKGIVMQRKRKEHDEGGEYIRQVLIMASRTSLLILMLLSVRRWFKTNWSLSLVHLTTMLLMFFCCVFVVEGKRVKSSVRR